MLLYIHFFVIWIQCFLLPFASAAPKPSIPLHRNVQRFHLDLTWETASPNGVERKVILTNGQFPGPQLDLVEGDEVEIVVSNSLPFATALHFHGITQQGTPWSDGVPGITQRPIPSGKSFIYRWTAVEYGTYWYHGHNRGQVSDGLIGAIVIKPAEGRPAPFKQITSSPAELKKIRKAELNPKPMFVSDWSHYTSHEYFTIAKEGVIDNICVDSILINGKGSVICKSQDEYNSMARPDQKLLLGEEKLTDKGCLPYDLPIIIGNSTVNHDKIPDDLFSQCHAKEGEQEIISVNPADGWASINLIASSSITSPIITIDEHKMWIYAIDGNYIDPVLVDGIPSPNGNRYSVLVKLDKKPGDYTIRAANLAATQVLSGFATLRYEAPDCDRSRPSKPSIGYNGLNLTADFVPFDETAVKPYPPSKPAAVADTTYKFDIGLYGAPFLFTVSGKSTLNITKDIEPMLFDPEGELAQDKAITFRTKNGTWVDLIFATKGFNPPHPMHKHSNKVYVIGQGTGEFKWETVADAIKEVPEFFNLETPRMVDGFTTPPGTDEAPGWVVVRYQVINPGPFLLHCHIQTHFDGGMGIVLLDGVDELPEVPDEYLDNPFF
ncbi:hypothetical protein FQN50_008239 [Emmonsiellopsis sp. PD_5]|nr:hypothetical protein FQN50_008239 [Emmonsiellopsis sp. PD_5]